MQWHNKDKVFCYFSCMMQLNPIPHFPSIPFSLSFIFLTCQHGLKASKRQKLVIAWRKLSPINLILASPSLHIEFIPFRPSTEQYFSVELKSRENKKRNININKLHYNL